MDQKISDLDVAISMTASDIIPIVDSNGNNKVLHGSQVKDYVADAVVSDIDDVKAMISDEYDNTATYAVGDYCIYNNTLYRCTTAISTAEDFTPAHWTETSIDAELDTKADKSDIIGNYSTGVIKFNTLTFTQSASGMYYAPIDLDNALPAGKSIIGITIEGWNNLRSTDMIIPYIRTTRSIGIMSNVNSFTDINSGYGYRILYI